MKNPIKLLLLGMVVAFMLVSCNDSFLKKGGTIKLTNDVSGLSSDDLNYYIVVKGVDVVQAWADLAGNKGELIKKGETKTITKDEDGFYTVIAVFPNGFLKTVYLALGSVENITIK